ncbi:ANTAR domain-containing protein [Amycolatopsis sp. FDAARGOS 1241]|uniref:ANTAR domain-containing protein n=1 Tax=Amycolatopsis sp. FDAARGOS 1241 TaxID=2778070 RepID=UPI00194E8E1A|nr:ANTAR domain-containing protein [Amycolatopsis sp. FDAARGOS 1241]QRP48431.1 ANTAR domain-containing protein [Amycolatopsis sp. FDAARGOS 1241]
MTGPPSVDEVPVGALLYALLTRICDDIPGGLGAAVSVHHGDEPLAVLVAAGIAGHLAPAQIQLFGGPIVTAAETGETVVTADAFTDPRWPKLTREAVTEQFPERAATWRALRGFVARPSPFDCDSTLVLSASLAHSCTDEALHVLARYERLVCNTIVVIQTDIAAGSEQMIALLRSHAVIEQAKGAIVAVRGCSADEAWETLRRASQEFNVKARDLAAALVEHLGHAQVTTPEGLPQIVPPEPARYAAALVWAALATPE